jgi:peptidoglycan/LPS O-acetylase OafA/YrhL
MKLKEVERLRAIAILIVINAHLGSPFFGRVFRGGWHGVDLFFVISGFVITRSFLGFLPRFESTDGIKRRFSLSAHSLKKFYVRRIFRIVPAAVGWIVFTILLSLLVPSPLFGSVHDQLNEAWQILTLRYNYFVAAGGTGNFSAYWSLMVEEHFYLLFPMVMILLATYRQRLFGCGLGIFIAAVVIRSLLDRAGNTEIEVTPTTLELTHRRFDILLVGVAVALLRRNGFGDSLAKLNAVPFLLISTALIVIFWGMPGWLESSCVNLKFVVSEVLAGALVFLSTIDRGFVLNFPFLSRALEYVGSRSYGLYLAQGTFLKLFWALNLHASNFFQRVLGVNIPNINVVVFYLLPLFIVVEISYRCLERPFIKLGARLASSPG